jgi:hypothetical protein
VSFDDLTLGLAPQALCLRLLRRLSDFLCKAMPIGFALDVVGQGQYHVR